MNAIVRRSVCALAFLLLVCMAQTAYSGENCEHCGHECTCRKVCRLVKEDKKVPIVCWGMQVEEFCVPKHSKLECRHKDRVCQDCDVSDGKTHSGKGVWFSWSEWLTKGACKYTRHKLMKKTITKTVPSYKWVLETVCDECESKCASVVPEPGVKVPPPPVMADAAIKQPGE